MPTLKGYVRNLRDGRVEAVFLRQDDDVLRMIEWCRKGPLFSSVKGTEVVDETPDPSQYPGFEIRADGAGTK